MVVPIVSGCSCPAARASHGRVPCVPRGLAAGFYEAGKAGRLVAASPAGQRAARAADAWGSDASCAESAATDTGRPRDVGKVRGRRVVGRSGRRPTRRSPGGRRTLACRGKSPPDLFYGMKTSGFHGSSAPAIASLRSSTLFIHSLLAGPAECRGRSDGGYRSPPRRGAGGPGVALRRGRPMYSVGVPGAPTGLDRSTWPPTTHARGIRPCVWIAARCSAVSVRGSPPTAGA